MMEGVSSEAASFAGHQGLANLCWIYDSNRVTIEGHTDIAFTEDVAARFAAYGWNVTSVTDANDLELAERAFHDFRAEHERPTLVVVHSHIGYGTDVEDTPKAHGEPLGPEGVRDAKRFFGWPEDAQFLVPDGVYEHFAAGIGARGRAAREAWETGFEAYRAEHPELAGEVEAMQRRELPDGWDADIPTFPPDEKGLASRDSSGQVLNAVAQRVPWLLGGSADLSPSTKTHLAFDGAGDFEPGEHWGRNLHFGIREFAAAAIANGLALTKVRPYWSGFLIFSDYARGAIRLSALMEIPVIHVFTHDSIGVGEDGPTHQPVEQLASLRAMPGLLVFRPADANEVAETWRYVMQLRHEPAVLVLSRQALPTVDRSALAPASGLTRGAYVLADVEGSKPDVVLMATGSEVALALSARDELAGEGIGARVVSMPCLELFDRQPQAYRDEVLPPSVGARVAVEQASTLGWGRYVGDRGAVVGMHTFGASAPLKMLVQKFGFTPDAVADVARERLATVGAAREEGFWLRPRCSGSAARGRRSSATTRRSATFTCAPSSPKTLSAGSGWRPKAPASTSTTPRTGSPTRRSGSSSSSRRSRAWPSGSRRCSAGRRSTSPRTAPCSTWRSGCRRASRSSWTAWTSSPRCTRCSTAWRPSATASARASGRAIPASRSGTSSTSASAAPTSGR
jgi:transketolase